MIWLIIIGIFIIAQVLVLIAIHNAPLMPDDYDLREEDIWPVDQRPIILSESDSKIFEEHLNNPQEPNTKLKEATKLYKDANTEANKNNRNK